MTSSAATILIVDDESANRKLLEVLLAPEGYLTRCAASGEEALATIAEHAPDLILLDILMPGIGGYEVAAILKGRPETSDIPIIVLTVQNDRDARLAALKAGAEEFLTKPIERAELWLRVRNLLRLKAFGDHLKNYNAVLEREVRERTAELRRFRAAMDATSDAILLISRNTMNYVDINAAACAMTGYTREEFFELGPARIGKVNIVQLAQVYDHVIAGISDNDLVGGELQHRNGSPLHVELRRQAYLSDGDRIIVEVMRDISERRAAEMRLQHMAHYDSLTGLPNRTLLYATLDKTLAQASAEGELTAVLFIDLDHFKNVNDTLGHVLGDELLSQLSSRLVQCVRTRDMVGRLGGDEFALILMVQDSPRGADVVANKIRDVLRLPFDLNGHEVTVTASIGIAIHPTDAADAAALIKYADTAMYRAKQAGRDTCRFFTAQMNADMQTRLELETALRRAVEKGEFVLYYQPKVRIDTGRVTGLEALLRWQRPGYGFVPPDVFIPVLEDTGLILPVGSWVVATACKQIALWMRSAVGPRQVAVNVSGRQFQKGNLDQDVDASLREYDVPPDLLELELTESSLMANTEHAIASMQELKKRGVHISIDDFGTGYSSLAYLRRFPIDKLKIDIAFIRDIGNDSDDGAIALAIIRMAHSLKLEVIAEGVETEAQMDFLRNHGCDQIQGYYFSKSLPVAELEKLLLEDRRLGVPDFETMTRLR